VFLHDLHDRQTGMGPANISGKNHVSLPPDPLPKIGGGMLRLLVSLSIIS
jgi:hypothetical protein